MGLEIKSFSEFEVNEKSAYYMERELEGLIGTSADQDMWNWFEKNMPDAGYAGNMTPEDYLEKMTDKQTAALYKAMKEYL